jgi:hypothetical protein
MGSKQQDGMKDEMGAAEFIRMGQAETYRGNILEEIFGPAPTKAEQEILDRESRARFDAMWKETVKRHPELDGK